MERKHTYLCMTTYVYCNDDEMYRYLPSTYDLRIFRSEDPASQAGASRAWCASSILATLTSPTFLPCRHYFQQSYVMIVIVQRCQRGLGSNWNDFEEHLWKQLVWSNWVLPIYLCRFTTLVNKYINRWPLSHYEYMCGNGLEVLARY